MRDYPQSQALYKRAQIIPGRSMTRSKAPGRLFLVGSGPLYAQGSHGAELIDVDGHRFIDTICGLGAIGLGHRAQRVFTGGAYVPVSYSGRLHSLPHAVEVEAAEAILRHVAPWANSVRFVKTGSEATHAAYRIAKRATDRRPFVLIGDWAYHGWHEWCERRPDGLAESFHTIFYRHGQDLESTMQHGVHELNVEGSEIAAVFVEPHRWEPIDMEWLQAVRAYCTRVGALLVFDEMIYGCRWAIGGATEYFGVTPDLACFGKAIGNGAPVACIVGREALAEHGELVSGTYSGEAASLETVCSVLDEYVACGTVDQLWSLGSYLQGGLRSAIVLSGMEGRVFLEGQAVHQRLRFEGDADLTIARSFAALMAARGVLWHPSVVNICAAHTTAQLDRVASAAKESLLVLSRQVAA